MDATPHRLRAARARADAARGARASGGRHRVDAASRSRGADHGGALTRSSRCRFAPRVQRGASARLDGGGACSRGDSPPPPRRAHAGVGRRAHGARARRVARARRGSAALAARSRPHVRPRADARCRPARPGASRGEDGAHAARRRVAPKRHAGRARDGGGEVRSKNPRTSDDAIEVAGASGADARTITHVAAVRRRTTSERAAARRRMMGTAAGASAPRVLRAHPPPPPRTHTRAEASTAPRRARAHTQWPSASRAVRGGRARRASRARARFRSGRRRRTSGVGPRAAERRCCAAMRRRPLGVGGVAVGNGRRRGRARRGARERSAGQPHVVAESSAPLHRFESARGWRAPPTRRRSERRAPTRTRALD